MYMYNNIKQTIVFDKNSIIEKNNDNFTSVLMVVCVTIEVRCVCVHSLGGEVPMRRERFVLAQCPGTLWGNVGRDIALRHLGTSFAHSPTSTRCLPTLTQQAIRSIDQVLVFPDQACATIKKVCGRFRGLDCHVTMSSRLAVLN